MKSNVKSGLSMKGIIATVLTLITIFTSIQILSFTNGEIQVANEKENQIEQEIKIAEREEAIARASQERIEEVIENQYITIDEIEISRDMDLTQRCGISKEDFIELMTNLKVDTSGFFEENAEIIYDLREKYELNEVFFCGLIAAESGWNIASNHRNKCNYISMMSGGTMIRYSSPEEGLEAAAKLLHNKYLTEGGSCYYGKTLSCVQRRFCPNSSTWVGLVYGCMKQVVK